ncbi:ewing's tumor-associated antigen 1-like [Trematomus bernacchii]|uniref:ewing's tumor-associated antigen 1-like n=1 Tax=Trematomus bernacchii TaxID=40690 RepID=UPI00146D8BC4|nr:ewing's tumor-associated antigen 1-like [Trematomus bernacchii]
MNRGRVEAPSGQPVKTNRLRRSFRQTQNTQTAGEEDSPIRPKSEFKTPTRIPRSRTGVFSAESPHNDSDFQQDIIWDPTSPSPNRFGKKAAKKQPVRVVNISDIVNRIAPKHGRPKVAEPTLQQWIGDTIPCTPDVQVPKHKRKSPRLNTVDDLLKLAKQFDFNMFRQEEDEEEELKDLHQQSLELLSDDILDQNDFSPSLPGNQPPAVSPGPDVQLHLMDQHMEDDLDFLFDGPTQHLSGNLSQVLSAQPSQAKPAAKEASGKTSASSHTPTPVVPTSNTKDDFDDDWENDDLLNDSLVLEMTQNPHKFISPKHASTQKQPSQVTFPRESQRNVVQSAVSKVEKDNVRQRASFKLEPNPNFPVKPIQTDTWANSNVDYSSKKADKDTFSSGNSVLKVPGSQYTWQTSNTVKSQPLKPQFNQKTAVSTFSTASNIQTSNTMKSDPPRQQFNQNNSVSKYNSASSTASNTSKTTFPIKPTVVSTPAVSEHQEEDLSIFFESDPVWDDLADDDLLCEMCEDVENQIQNVPKALTKQPLPAGPVSNQRATLQPYNQQTFIPKKPTPTNVSFASGRAAGSSLAAGFVSNVGAQVTNSFRSTQVKNSSGSTNSSMQSGGNHREKFTFKKPNKPVSTVTSNDVGKCSAAEIALKKQQAMEKRRQRLQAQNL